MSTVDDLLQRVLDDPDDIAMRCVYADALSDAGDPRGELIQLQCAERPLGRTQKSREKALLKKHLDEWLGPLAKVVLKRGLRAGRARARRSSDESAEAVAIRRSPVGPLRRQGLGQDFALAGAVSRVERDDTRNRVTLWRPEKRFNSRSAFR
jgi:uncharacterized protein (TIGR02996 family)